MRTATHDEMSTGTTEMKIGSDRMDAWS
jgi:hypothetical protein